MLAASGHMGILGDVEKDHTLMKMRSRGLPPFVWFAALTVFEGAVLAALVIMP
ncbi:MAG: hypothetical protein H3C28_02995 [Sphingomonadales bacterium]|nr:hypothetical protein [Sphingomonadales bacterium]